MEKLTPNMEDYMKAIYQRHRQDSGGVVHISDIAADMGLRKASVCKATGVLEEKGLLKKDRYKCLYLTKKGLQFSQNIEQRYSVITKFLNCVLGVELEIAQKDACGMEHVISAECCRSMSEFLQEQTV